MSGKNRAHEVSSDGDAPTSGLHRQAFQLVHALSKWAFSNGPSSHLDSLSLYPPSPRRGNAWLVVGRGWIDGLPVVAFHKSPDPLTALLGFLNKAYSGSLNWKRDEFRKTEAEQITSALP